jgi:outer membrane biosynthesis protein TonB
MSARRVAVAIVAIVVVVLIVLWLRQSPDTPSPTASSAAVTASTSAGQPPSADEARAEGRQKRERSRAARDKMRADILDMLRKRGEPVRPDPPPRAPAEKRPKHADSADEPHGRYDPAYIQSTFREDMFPLLRQCYESALARRPDLGGKLTLRFTIVGDGDVGGVVEDAEIHESSTIQDEEMETCARESLMTLTFDKPPKGGGYVTVNYPIVFSNGPPPDEPSEGGVAD